MKLKDTYTWSGKAASMSIGAALSYELNPSDCGESQGAIESIIDRINEHETFLCALLEELHKAGALNDETVVKLLGGRWAKADE
jgi:hypothetical protein